MHIRYVMRVTGTESQWEDTELIKINESLLGSTTPESWYFLLTLYHRDGILSHHGRLPLTQGCLQEKYIHMRRVAQTS